MSNANNSKYNLANASIGILADQAQSGSHLKGIGTQHNYTGSLERNQTLAKLAAEINILASQIENIHPHATEDEKAELLEAELARGDVPTIRERLLSAIRSGGKEALIEILARPWVSGVIGAIEGWRNPRS